MKNTISDIKNTSEVLHSSFTEAEEWINDLENKVEKKHTIRAAKRNRMKKIEGSLRELWDTMKYNNIYIIGVPEEETEQGIKNLFKGKNDWKLPCVGEGKGI